jgi:hypothetical protein
MMFETGSEKWGFDCTAHKKKSWQPCSCSTMVLHTHTRYYSLKKIGEAAYFYQIAFLKWGESCIWLN